MDAWSYVFPTIQIGLFVIGLLNLFVVVLIAVSEKFRTISNIQIFNLCLSCLLYCSILPFLAIFAMESTWHLGTIGCKLIFGIESVSKVASIFFVMLAALERYLAVCRHVVRSQYWTFGNALIISAAAWLICIGKLAINIPSAYRPYSGSRLWYRRLLHKVSCIRLLHM